MILILMYNVTQRFNYLTNNDNNNNDNNNNNKRHHCILGQLVGLIPGALGANDCRISGTG